MFTDLTSTEAAAVKRGLRKSPFNGLTEREIGKYSLLSELVRLAYGGAPEKTFEAELTAEAMRQRESGDALIILGNKVIVPPQVWATRAMATIPGSKGGYLSDVDMLSPIASLQPRSTLLSAGAQVVPGLAEPVIAPRAISAPSVTWQAPEGQSVTPADPTFGAVSAVPHTLIGLTTISRQLVVQAPQLAEQTLMRELTRKFGAELDRVGLQGAGGGAEPLGVLNTGGIGTQAGASLAYTDVLDMQRKVAEANADDGQVAFIGTPAVRKVLSARERVTGNAGFMWDEGRMAGAPAYATTNMPTGTLLCGAWDLVTFYEFFSGIELEVSASPGFNTGSLTVRALLWVDVACTFPAAFVAATSVT